MCLAQGPQCSDAGEARTRGPSVSSQAHCTPCKFVEETVFLFYIVNTPGLGVPVYLAPWTACPRCKLTAVGSTPPPPGKLSSYILPPPTLVIFTHRGQTVQPCLSCPPPNTSKKTHVILLLFCIILMNSDPP